MSSENASSKGGKKGNQESIDTSKTVHPKVIAKKTFFDVHRSRRSTIDVGASENDDGPFHPRIQWTAGSTDIGGRDQNRRTLNVTPILKSSKPTTSAERRLPPVPDTWGAMDAQPTQLEEISHLINPSAVLERTDIEQEKVPISGKKFVEKFRKSTAKVIAATRLVTRTTRDSTLLEENVESAKPEEEFRLLNETYAHEGVLAENFQPTLSSAGPEGEKKRVKIYPDRQGHSRTNESKDGSSPLPARRSCEPLDVKDLRKISKGTPDTMISDSGNDADLTNTAESVSDESLSEKKKDIPRSTDRFRIDNPFSDFSLQTLGRDKSATKPHAMAPKKIPLYLDAEPSTSKGVSPVDTHIPKVSPSDIIQHPESQRQGEHFSDSEASKMRKSSLLDMAVTTGSSERTIGERRHRVKFSDVSEDSRAIFQPRNVWALSTLIPRVLGENVETSGDSVRRNDFRNGDENLPITLKVNALMPIFGILDRDCLTTSLRLTRSTFDPTAIIIQNCAWTYSTRHSTYSSPTIILDLAGGSEIPGMEFRADYLPDLGRDELCEIVETLASPEVRKNYPSLQFERGHLMGDLTRYVVDVLSENPHGHSSSFGPIAAQMPTGDSARGYKYSRPFSSAPRGPLLVSLVSHCTPFVVFLEKFLDFRQTSRTR